MTWSHDSVLQRAYNCSKTKRFSTVVQINPYDLIYTYILIYIYRKNSWAYICSKGFLLSLFSGSLLSRLIIGGAYCWREICVSKWVGIDNKNSLNTKKNRLKKANSNSPWAYFRKGLLSEGYLRLSFGGAYFREGFFFYFFINFFFSGGEAYYRNFTVFIIYELSSSRI